jgi:hypothetical protein
VTAIDTVTSNPTASEPMAQVYGLIRLIAASMGTFFRDLTGLANSSATHTGGQKKKTARSPVMSTVLALSVAVSVRFRPPDHLGLPLNADIVPPRLLEMCCMC